MDGLSEREYSSHSGLSRGAIQKAGKDGRLVVYGDGSINAAASDARRSEMIDPDQQRRSTGGDTGFSGPADSSSYLKARTALTAEFAAALVGRFTGCADHRDDLTSGDPVSAAGGRDPDRRDRRRGHPTAAVGIGAKRSDRRKPGATVPRDRRAPVRVVVPDEPSQRHAIPCQEPPTSSPVRLRS